MATKKVVTRFLQNYTKIRKIKKLQVFQSCQIQRVLQFH